MKHAVIVTGGKQYRVAEGDVIYVEKLDAEAGSTNEFYWTYLPGSDLKESLTYPNGDVVRWEYEPQRDLLTIVSNATHSTFRYTYDGAGRRVSKNDERYGYNARGELILATNIVDGTAFAYAYDDIGNRLSSYEFGTNATYTANNLNQYTEIVRGGIAEHPQFDADGNQTDITTGTGRWLVEYNGENRPVRWMRPADGKTIETSYDRMGRRVKSGEETFVYDGYLNIGTTIWDPTEPIATRPLVWLGEDVPAYYFHDGNKNVVNLVGATSSSYSYAPFGMTLNRLYEDVNPWGLGSEWYDDSLRVVYYNHRHFAVCAGRWMIRDALDEEGGMNLYTYCRNGCGIDCLGLFECCECTYAGNLLPHGHSTGFSTIGGQKCFYLSEGSSLEVIARYSCVPKYFAVIGDCLEKMCEVATRYRYVRYNSTTRPGQFAFFWEYVSDEVSPCAAEK